MKRKMIVIVVTMIFIFSLSSLSKADYTYSYKVNSGDKKNFKMTQYNNQGQSSVTELFNWNDGTSDYVTFKAGTTFTVTVCYISTDSYGYTDAYMSMTINGKTTSCDSSLPFVTSLPDDPTVYDLLVAQDSTSYQHSGNIFTVKDSYDDGSYTETLTIKIDTNTGWITQYLDQIFNDNTGALEYVQEIQQAGGKSGLPGFELVPVLLFAGIIAPIVLLKRKRQFKK